RPSPRAAAPRRGPGAPAGDGPGEPGAGEARARRDGQPRPHLRPHGRRERCGALRPGGRHAVSDPRPMDLPAFSIVMPTYQRRDSLRQTLLALAAAESPRDRLELVLVSDGSTDGSIEMARSLDLPFALRALEQRNQGPAAARNLALASAAGPFVLFLDDDVLP